MLVDRLKFIKNGVRRMKTMKIRTISVIAMTLLMMASQSTQAMFLRLGKAWRKTPRIVKAGVGIGTAAWLYDYYQQDRLDIIDVSTPSSPSVLDYNVTYPQLDDDVEWNKESITKLHLTQIE